MFDSLRRPVPLRPLILGLFAAAVLVAFYCLAYSWLAGRPETLPESLGWALANICPWLAAIEGGKRAGGWRGAATVLAAATFGSVGLGYVLAVSDDSLGFEIWRRAPALAAAAALVTILRSGIGKASHAHGKIPLLPSQIEWVRAAGNYVELRATGRTIVHRASLSAIEQQLASHGFIRIHRSLLVRRNCIARIRSEDVVLADGTHHPIGKRYRAALAT